MAKQRFINTKFWDDSWIVDLTSDQKLIYLYLLTNPLTTIAGSYEITVKRIAYDTALSPTIVYDSLSRFEADGKIVYRDGRVLILNFIKHQSNNPKIKQGIVRELSCCPDWVNDRLSKPIDSESLPTIYSNSNSNSDLYLLRGEEIENQDAPRSQENNPLSTSSSSLEKITPPRSHTPATPAAEKLDTWLDAIAQTCGASDSNALPKRRKWELVCMTAIRENRDLDKMLAIVTAELERTKGQEHFFSPDTVLQKLQADDIAPPPKPTLHIPTVAEKLADDAAVNAWAMANNPPPKESLYKPIKTDVR